MKILVTGKNGQVGSEIQAVANQFPTWEFVFVGREEMDLSKEDSVKACVARHSPQWVLNCAAYTAVDKAETERELAEAINAWAPGWLAEACALCGAKLLHLSTDYVYRADANKPIQEDFPAGPQNHYGATKLMGDERVLHILPQSIVLRTSWVYSSFGNNFVKTMLRLGKERPQLNIVFDQVGSPTYAKDLALAMLKIIENEDIKGGVYHYSNEGVTSWYDFALAIFEIANIHTCKVMPILSSQYPTPATRPSYSLLDKGKVKRDYGLEIPHWRDALARMMTEV